MNDRALRARKPETTGLPPTCAAADRVPRAQPDRRSERWNIQVPAGAGYQAGYD